jgi:hypothetical protein
MTLATLSREEGKDLVLFLPGIGCVKENFAGFWEAAGICRPGAPGARPARPRRLARLAAGERDRFFRGFDGQVARRRPQRTTGRGGFQSLLFTTRPFVRGYRPPAPLTRRPKPMLIEQRAMMQ